MTLFLVVTGTLQSMAGSGKTVLRLSKTILDDQVLGATVDFSKNEESNGASCLFLSVLENLEERE